MVVWRSSAPHLRMATQQPAFTSASCASVLRSDIGVLALTASALATAAASVDAADVAAAIHDTVLLLVVVGIVKSALSIV